jgi:antitoxin component YwqK of YwqJK toxin-antitoxin module
LFAPAASKIVGGRFCFLEVVAMALSTNSLVLALSAGAALAALSQGAAAGPDDYLKYTIPKEAVGKEVTVRRGEPFSRAVEFTLNGKLVGRREYYEGGNLYREVAYQDGKQHGIERRWFSSGQLQFESPYKGGERHGTFKQWGQSKKLLGSYEMKRGTGVRKLWHENGRLAESMPYQKGREDGYFKRLHANGKPNQVLRFKQGKAHGVSWIWGGDGRLAEGSPIFFLGGKRVSKEAYEKARKKDPTLPRPDDDRVPQ